jgi:cell division protein FtsL
VKKAYSTIKPFLSVFIILLSLFAVVYVKMENRRMGYVLLDLAEKEKQATQKQRLALVNLARMTSPERVRKIATTQLTFQNAKEGQVIRVAGSGTAAVK